MVGSTVHRGTAVCSLNCSDVLADSVTINGDLRWPNNDGIDVTSCNDTIIRDCSITTGAQRIQVRMYLQRGCRNCLYSNKLLLVQGMMPLVQKRGKGRFKNYRGPRDFCRLSFVCSTFTKEFQGSVCTNRSIARICVVTVRFIICSLSAAASAHALAVYILVHRRGTATTTSPLRRL